MKKSVDACMTKTASTPKTASGIIVYLIEELGDARLRCAQLKHYVKEATDLIEKSDQRDHFFEVAGHLIHGIPDVLLRLDNALDASAMAASRLDYDEVKNSLRPEKAEELENILGDVRLRYLNRRSGEEGDRMAAGRTLHLEGKAGHTLCGEHAYPDTIVKDPKEATCFYCVTAWEKANDMGSMYSRHLHATTTTRTNTMNAKTAAQLLNKLADLTEKGGKVPARDLMSLIAKLERQDRTAAALAPKAAEAFRGIAKEITASKNPSRVKLAGVLRRILADTLEMPVATQQEQQMQQQAGAGEEFQKANPKITDEEAKKIDEQHEKNKDNFKA